MEDHRAADTFDPKTERIEDYKERFDFYCVVHGVEEAKEKALFLTRIGQTAYSKLKTLVSPTPLAELDLNTIVESWLQKQLVDGELQPVDQSEWATPIVVVKDGSIRICADFKTTVNPHLQMKTFPLPTPDEVFSTLAHGESFSKLDLARAYKQMEVEESS